MTRINIVIAAGLALAATLPVSSAQAQSPRTFVSAAGSDSNPCSFAAPCRHFQAAVNATSPGGEVDALDPAGYGPITITQAITIEGQGWSYIAPPVSGNGITINAVSGNFFIHGVLINGAGITGPINGIVFNSGNVLTVRDCVIRNFNGDGIDFLPTGSTATQLLVSNTLVSDNSGEGILIAPPGSASVAAVLDQIEVANSFDGILAENSGGVVHVMVRNSSIINNFDAGLHSESGGTTVRVTRSTITGNGAGWAVFSGGVISSYGDNNIDGNGTDNTAPPSIAYK